MVGGVEARARVCVRAGDGLKVLAPCSAWPGVREQQIGLGWAGL